ncbi:putative quinol monooxygenase [Halpernia sp. GG3]
MLHVHVVATFEFKVKDAQKALKLMENMVAETVKEEGCIRFEMIEDQERDAFFFLNEVWENKEFHNKHMQTSHFKEFISGIKDILQSQVVYKGRKAF